jgi:hypothetical protein
MPPLPKRALRCPLSPRNLVLAGLLASTILNILLLRPLGDGRALPGDGNPSAGSVGAVAGRQPNEPLRSAQPLQRLARRPSPAPPAQTGGPTGSAPLKSSVACQRMDAWCDVCMYVPRHGGGGLHSTSCHVASCP